MRNLQGVLSFAEAARAGSLSAAARKLGLTPAAVSKNVKRLEADLGARLFNRSTRKLRLTAEGETFLGRAECALRELDEAVAEIGQKAGVPAGRVRISVGAAFGRHWVLPALPSLLAEYPELRVELDLENRQVDLVAEGFDIGIRGGLIRDSSLIARRVCALPLVLVASPGYCKRRGVPRSPAELADHECVTVRFRSGSTPAWAFRENGQLREQTPDARLTVTEPEAAIDLALADGGIIQAGLHHVARHLRDGRLQTLLRACHWQGEREIVLHYPHRQFLAPRVRVAVEHLLRHFASAADLHLQPDDLAPFDA